MLIYIRLVDMRRPASPAVISNFSSVLVPPQGQAHLVDLRRLAPITSASECACHVTSDQAMPPVILRM